VPPAHNPKVLVRRARFEVGTAAPGYVRQPEARVIEGRQWNRVTPGFHGIQVGGPSPTTPSPTTASPTTPPPSTGSGPAPGASVAVGALLICLDEDEDGRCDR
jgi:hypothetical protein